MEGGAERIGNISYCNSESVQNQLQVNRFLNNQVTPLFFPPRRAPVSMAPPPPPSFSSFPSPSPKPPPPSFSSFPPPRRSPSPHSDDRPSKRPRATEFLQELESEIYGPVASGSGEGRGKGRERGGGSRDEEGEGGRISKSGAKSSKKRERRSKDVEYEEGSLDPMGKGREHETKLGDYGKVSSPCSLGSLGLMRVDGVDYEGLETRQGAVGGEDSRSRSCTSSGSLDERGEDLLQ